MWHSDVQGKKAFLFDLANLHYGVDCVNSIWLFNTRFEYLVKNWRTLWSILFMRCICYDVVIYILSNWFRSNSLFTSNRMHYLKTPTTKLLQSRVLFSHFSRINQKRFFEFDWTFYFIPITRNDIFCKRKRHTYLAGVQHSICFQQYIFTQPKLWQQAKIKTTFLFYAQYYYWKRQRNSFSCCRK